jgi:hypothetical protein
LVTCAKRHLRRKKKSFLAKSRKNALSKFPKITSRTKKSGEAIGKYCNFRFREKRANESASNRSPTLRNLRRTKMIKNAAKIFLMLALALFGGLTSVLAQMDSDTTLDANIPFQFVVGKTTFPAGKYTIKPVDDSDDTANVIEISSADECELFSTPKMRVSITRRKNPKSFSTKSATTIFSRRSLSKAKTTEFRLKNQKWKRS